MSTAIFVPRWVITGPFVKTYVTLKLGLQNWSKAFFNLKLGRLPLSPLPPRFFSFFQILRALRLVIDTGLHYKGMKRDDALKMFADYAWDESDFARKEVTK